MYLFVKTATGRTLTLNVEPTDTVLTVKKRVEEQTKLPVSQQTITFAGKVLKDESILDEVGVKKEAVIHLILKKEEDRCVKSVSKTTTTTTSTSCSSSSSSDCSASITPQEALPYTKDETTLMQMMMASMQPGELVEVVFCFDTTGSMYSCLQQVRTELRKTVTRLLKDIPHIRIGIMAIGDYCDSNGSYVVKLLDLTADTNALCNFADTAQSTSGGDSPEAYELALQWAVRRVSWTDAASKALVMIADDVPHPPSYTDQRVYWRTELAALCALGVKVYGVQAQNNGHASLFYKELADLSGGIYLRFTQFKLITDMFLAVCYRESTPEKLAEFQEEVKKEGRLQGELGQIFTQLAQPTKAPEKEVQIKPLSHEPWWDADKYDKQAVPQYMYVPETDKWVPYSPTKARSSTVCTSTPSYTPPTTECTPPSTTTTSVPARKRSLLWRLFGFH